MSKNILYLLLAVSLGLNVGVIATTIVHRTAGPPEGPPPGQGQRGGPGPGQRPDPAQLVEEHLQGMTRHLDLSPDQQQSIRAVLEEFGPQQVEFQMEVEQTSRRLTDAFGAPGFDPEGFRRLTTEASTARSRLDSLSAVMLVSEAAVLTQEQRLKFARVAPSIHSNPQRLQPQEGRPPPRH